VAVLLTGTTLAQAIPVLASPILARLYGPDQLGTYALFNAIVLVLSVPASGLYEMAVVLPRRDDEAVNVMAAAILTTVGSALLIHIGAIAFGTHLALQLGNDAIGPWLPFVALSVVLINVFQVLSYWTNRKQRYDRLSFSRVSRALAVSGTNIGMGVMHVGAVGLVAGGIAGQGVGATTLAWQVWRDDGSLLAGITWGRIRSAAIRFREFALFAAPTSLLNSAAVQAPIFFLTHSFNPATTGQFSLAATVIAAPSALIATSVQQVYYQRIAALRNTHPDRLRDYLLRTSGHMAAIAVLPTVLLLGFGPFIFATVFGDEWRTAGEFARIVALAAAINFVVAPVSSMLSVSGNIKLGSVWKCAYFCTTIGTLSLASRLAIRPFLAVYAIHQIVLYGIYYALILRAASNVRGRPSDQL
jgi:O-antigen/teichoic acid export membrane protein